MVLALLQNKVSTITSALSCMVYKPPRRCTNARGRALTFADGHRSQTNILRYSVRRNFNFGLLPLESVFLHTNRLHASYSSPAIYLELVCIGTNLIYFLRPPSGGKMRLAPFIDVSMNFVHISISIGQ